MTEAEWNACADPRLMLEALRGHASDRKLRLFGVAICRGISAMINDPRSLRAIEYGEQSAEWPGPINYEALCDDHEFNAVVSAAFDAVDHSNLGLADAATVAISTLPGDERFVLESAIEGARFAQRAAENSGGSGVRQAFHQCDLLRDIFSHSAVSRISSAWQTPTVLNLAEVIYTDRAFDRLPILADALEDAGCTERSILDHCRQPGVHVRGCWVVDLVLGKS